jgi:hypothetical protein
LILVIDLAGKSRLRHLLWNQAATEESVHDPSCVGKSASGSEARLAMFRSDRDDESSSPEPAQSVQLAGMSVGENARFFAHRRQADKQETPAKSAKLRTARLPSRSAG